MDTPQQTIEIERVGGFAGFGGPGSHLRSRGTLDWAHLSAAERQHLSQLLSPTTTPASRSAPPAASAASTPRGAADGFRYRITTVHDGHRVTVELPEDQVPAALRDCVRDELI